MARKAVKKAVKRAATVKKQYVVGYVMREGNDIEFLMGVFDSIQKAKDEAEGTYDSDGEIYSIFEVKLVAQSERATKLNWKSK